MGAPQIVMIVWLAIAVGIGIADHGKPKEGETSAWVSLIGSLIIAAILWWGGFFS